MADLTAAVHSGTAVLTDGGIETRLTFEQSAVTMDPELGSASLLLDPAGVEALRTLYTGYVRGRGPPVHSRHANIQSERRLAGAQFARRPARRRTEPAGG